MPKNKKTTTKKPDKDGLIYFTIFIVYFLMVASAFAYSTKFLSGAINSALSEPQNEILTEEYASLKLKEYSSVAQKLGLSATSQATSTNLQ